MTPYALWIPLTLFSNVLYCWLSVKYSGQFWKLYLTLELVALIPAWTCVAYFSKNIIFDSFIFDMLLVVSSPLVFMYFGQACHFTAVNYVGIALAVIGLILARLPKELVTKIVQIFY